ncbi:7 transmembrane sweet-taste receptor of 3 GCPR-domain-containing protein [Syncephalastrum racemosum]|uniref:7 transmembrane sweet-taste receptor of 3 GCPR-domain-containing protein n=1 Tax=Syncephalastrum racemosum TaxID=13706 RepID=A0A1X2H386_SYNRA|nr:7 transmembrane sweet-taste receptor of 3 GCPR-domain-containing protein [Syncephalastrum racemosum]
MAGDLTLTQPPVYHDQSTTPPSGIPTQTALNPGFTSPMAITIVSFVGLGAFLALAMMTVVMLYRKHEVFKASSPLFCVLELIGFTLCYVSTLFFMAFRSKFDCIMIPITFHVGLSLVLANLIAKNYRIYRIFNNIFITRTVVTDLQLLKVSGSMIFVETILLVLWLCTSDIKTIHVPVSFTAYIVGCSYQGPGTKVYVALLTTMAAGQLAFATFLAIKTRAVGKSYSKYSEYRQIGISVYNIFFSALIGFVIYSVPTMDYYTRHYLTGFTVVWATTFSMLILFLPKMHAFFFGKDKSSGGGKHSDLTDRETTTFTHQELISLNHMIATPGAMDPLFANENNPNKENKTVLEAHEARMPVQVVCKYIPFLAAWDMKHIFLLPRVGYFSFFSEKSHKGQVFSYSDASIVSSSEGAYIFRVRGRRLFDVHIQVATPEDLEQWCAWFNSTKGTSSGAFVSSNNTASFLSSSRDTAPTGRGEESKDMELRELTKMKSNLTAERHLLDRQESNITLESVDTCMHAPVLQPMDPQLNNTAMNVPSALAPRLSESVRRRRTTSNGTMDSHTGSTLEDRRRHTPSSIRLPMLDTSSTFSEDFQPHERPPPTTATVATPGSERTVVVDAGYDDCKHVQ